MASTVTFKFDRGDRVRSSDGLFVFTVVSRIDTDSGNKYSGLDDNRVKWGSYEKYLRLVRHKPAWLRRGAKIQWVEEGPHDVYVVVSVSRGTPPYICAHNLSVADHIMGFTCTESNMKFWRRVVRKK